MSKWQKLTAGSPGILLSMVALSLTAVRPILGPSSALWANPSLPCSDDAAFHLLRLTQLDHLLRQGIYYSRWAPDMAQGYGYPFFNFYAPLSYYLAALVSYLSGGLNLGLRLTFALGLLASGLAAYRLARDYFSRRAALVAAVAYLYAPYQAYDIFFRGNLAESAAWPLLPLSLWAMGRLVRQGGPGWLAAAALAYATVLLTHNVFALIFSPLLAAYALVVAWTADGGRSRPHRLAWAGGALLLGLILSAFFWLPAMAERAFVHSDRLLVPPVFVYWNNFLPWHELLAAPQPIRPDLINPSPPRALGLVPVLLGLPGLVGLLRPRRPGQRTQIAFFALAFLVYALMMTAVSRPIWDHLPLIEFVQFPWRLLGPAALCLAMLVAATIELLPPGSVGRLLAGTAVAALIVSNLYWLHPRYCPGLEQPTVADIQQFEQQSATIGTTAKGEYLPRTVQIFPPTPADAAFTTEGLPAGTTLSAQRLDGLRRAATIEAAVPVEITVNIFAYPGWRAWVDGHETPIIPSADYGLITFPVPSGRHELLVAFGETPLRLAADLASVAALFITGGLAIAAGVRRATRPRKLPPEAAPSARHLAPILWGVLLFLIAGWLLPRWPNPLYQAGWHDGQPAGLRLAPITADFVGGLRLLGLQERAEQMPADGALRLDLYWTAVNPVAQEYQAAVTLIGPDGQIWSPKGATLPRDFRSPPPTTHWLPGQYAQDSHLLEALPGTPPGEYRLALTLFDKQTLQPVAALPGQALTTDLGVLRLERPNRPTTLNDAMPQYTADATWGPLQLLGYNLDRAEAEPGSPFLLTLFWQATAAPHRAEAPQALPKGSAQWGEDGMNLMAQLALQGPDGSTALQLELPPVRADWPTSQWQAGDVWRGQHGLRLPASLAGGTYHWQLGLCAPTADPAGCEPLGEPTELGTLTIHAPDRLWEPPTTAIPLAASLGDVATLMGATVQPSTLPPGESLTVSLVWRAEAGITTATEAGISYHVFLHLLGPDGQIVAQSDGEPANWTRPTTGWLPGEFIPDERILPLPADLPPGSYHLVAGLYDPETGARLARSDGDEVGEPTAVLITTFTR